ncbi:MAG: tetratricopeptide repeat protein [Muribaculaceae bacterium]|nr:tetratricopeptide repeat protein [Muribaculaceae bacterium]
MKLNNFFPRRWTLGPVAALICASAPLFAGADVLIREDRLSPLAAGYLERARIMLDDGNFAGVVDQLKHLDTQGVRLSDRDREDCTYLLAIALYERADADCVDLLREFAETYPASSLSLSARLAAADYFFFAHHYANALAAYNDIDYSRIAPADRPLYVYRKALSLLKTGQYDAAGILFSQLESNKEYNIPSRYYLAFIEYIQGNLDKAYAGFQDVEKDLGDNSIEGISPAYYIAQIDYTRAEYEKVINLGNRLLTEKPVAELIPETQRIIGLSYFKLGDYTKAKDVLARYARTPDVPTASDATYALGVIDYREGDISNARNRFAQLTDLNNDLAQSAYLYLGQIAVKEGDSNAAAISFEKASRMSFDRNVTETALYNYIAARTRGGNIPFSSSIPLINGFLKEFPSSKFAPEVREYLANAYFNEKDYANALVSINQIPNPSQNVLSMKQKVLYELGMEAMTNNRASDAWKYLSEATQIKGEAAVRAQSYLWLGDAAYALGKYAEAEKAYAAYLAADRRGENRTLATYNLAYALLMQDKYKAAAASFADAMKADPMLPKRMYDDALIRMADAQYYNGDYKLALKNYTSAIENGAFDRDYATYRRAVMYGLSGDIKRKLSELSSMPSAFPDSKWLPNALLEKGQTYSALGDNAKATEAFEQLRITHRRTPQARKGMLNLALSYMKAGETTKGEEAYREVISKWPSSEEASLANDDLRRFYASRGELAEYAQFLKSVPEAPQLNPDEMEKLAFEGAETAFAENATSLALLEKYVADYPNGKFLAQALLDIAIGNDEKGEKNKALNALNSLLTRRGDSPQMREALLLKASILEDMGPSSSKEALETYRELEKQGGAEYAADAYAGIMRTADKDAERLKYAVLVKNSAGLSADQIEEAEFYEATALLRNGDAKKGEATLLKLASNPKSLSGAKAAVSLGKFYLDNGNVNGADKVLTAFTDAGSPHEYWLAKGFIYLADVCHLRNKDYLAVEYLKSLRDNYPGKELDIHDMIATRLEKWKK